MCWLSATAIELDATITTPMQARPTSAITSGMSKLPRGPCRRLAWVVSKSISAHLQRGEADQHQHDADDPEAHDHARLRPALQFEVVMDRRHAEHALAGHLEAGHLDHHRGGFHHEYTAHHQQHDFLAHDHGD